jgi:hypothetical protein
MAKAAGNSPERAAAEAAREGLSELRTTELGPQILLGFQYEALFQPGFARLPPWRQELSVVAFGLLVTTVALVIAPASFHQLAERGGRTLSLLAYSRRMLAWSFCPFAVAIGLNIAIVGAGELGVATAVAAGLGGAGLALFLWYGIEMMARRPSARPATAELQTTSLKDRIADLMTETRIVLPGVQALLGFQFAAYLTETFGKLEPGARAAHDLGLALLLISMILLMTPAPFHRLADAGKDSERTCRVGVACILGALATLAFGIAADAYVAISVVTKSAGAALAGGLVAASAGLGLWFAVPLARRRGEARRRSRSATPSKQSEDVRPDEALPRPRP